MRRPDCSKPGTPARATRRCDIDRYQYLVLLAACLIGTAPLEVFGKGVYRQPRRTVMAILPIAAIFIAWDALAIAGDVWFYNPQYITGWAIGGMPIEEILFFIVIPLCGLLTLSAVTNIVALVRSWHARKEVRQ